MHSSFEQLQIKFSRGLGWNGFFYVLYKILSLSLSLTLFKIMKTEDFSLWANLTSLVFLVLLWIDFGFRKSLPRYCPEFAHSKIALRRFISSIMIFQIIILLCIVPPFIYLQKTIYTTSNINIYYLGAGLLVVEGIVALLRLIYHSHFWIKPFTLITTITVLLEITICYLLIGYGIRNFDLLKYIIFTKIGSGLITIVISLIILVHMYRKHTHPNVNQKSINYQNLKIDFIKHSAMMWGSNIIKSLTERNFMVPLLTLIFGPGQANLYKVANDSALVFYRTIIKTIGITDTALFSHVEQLRNAKKLMPIAFTKVMTSIAALCLPLSGIVALASVFHHKMFSDECVFQLFFILVFGYLIESLLSPYERILEIKKRYAQLIIAYSPYAIMLAIGIYLNILTLIGLLGSILFIQCVRLVSSLLMIPYARREYTLRLPIKFITTLFMICLPIWLSLFGTLWWYIEVYQG
jgi:O-antigen/teichoic acid export membrane protein